MLKRHRAAATLGLTKTPPLDRDRLQLTEQLVYSDDDRRGPETIVSWSSAVLIARVRARHRVERLIGAVSEGTVRLQQRTEVQRIRCAERL